MKLSVIVPVYQSIGSLQRCVASIISQRVPEVEVILVDDGSTDGGGELCDSLAASESCIRVIHRQNGGLSAARNTGIEASSGDYLTFVDSDDELEPHSLSANMSYIAEHPDTDMLEYPVSVHHGSPREYQVTFHPHGISGAGIFAAWISEQGNEHAYACNKIVRRSLFNGIAFPEGETFEDIAVFPDIICRCNSVYFSNEGRYLYYDNPCGITAHYRFRTQEPLFRHNLRLAGIVREAGMRKEYARLWSGCLNILTVLYRCQDADMRYIDAAFARLDAVRPHLSDAISARNGFRSSVKYLFAALSGSGNVCRLFGCKKLPS